MSYSVTVLRLRTHNITIDFPRASRLRLITTSSMASTATSLWIAAPAYLPFADMTPKLVGIGFLIPFGVGYFSLFFAERRARRDLRPARANDYGSAAKDDGR
jgi:hypothetical protein